MLANELNVERFKWLKYPIDKQNEWFKKIFIIIYLTSNTLKSLHKLLNRMIIFNKNDIQINIMPYVNS